MSIFTDINKVSRATGDRRVIRIGVFIPVDCQLLDAAGVDIFGSMSYEYLSALKEMLPAAVIECAPSVQIHYIGSVPAGGRIPMTSNQAVVATNHYSDAEVAPGRLDIVYVPGPDPNAHFPEGAVDWLARQGATEGVDILSVCTGIVVCGAAGLLRGKEICGPRGYQDVLKQRGYVPRSMRGHELRWVQDGNFWSSGGVTNGNDLVAAYARATPKYFPRPLVEIICEQLEVGDRPQHYTKDMAIEKHIGELVAASANTADATA
ncbi:putative family protein [Rosellinia necatrix]|uniref:Putative family protein n=1 Tax=Rosellinia necatrix TaxID=77044 RepID=A0A1W2TDA0_ROSNE|nr:putative family protein [Rosellinia necatrix]